MLRDTDPLATESKDVSMCLAIPGQIVSIDTSGSLRMGRADFGGVVQEICLEYTPEIAIGDYAIVHVGFAIARLDLDRAKEILATIDQIPSG
ncbi:MAG: HypC/HybG/HupF family hydrogenase formation chaperone [Pirellula sp.]|jgi:hydrogenase expression/formation protein HypC